MSNKEIFEKGKIKVVWIEKDPDKIYSRMFDDLQDALQFAENEEEFLIFKLLRQKELKDFAWELLPYGKHKFYKFLFKSYKKYRKWITNVSNN